MSQFNQAKAAQKAWEYRKYGRPMKKAEPMSFKEWLRAGMEHYKKQGFVFEQVDKYTMRIIPPGKPAIFRTCDDFERNSKTNTSKNFNFFRIVFVALQVDRKGRYERWLN